MARKIRAVTGRDVAQIQGAINTLRSARKSLREAGASNAADYVARAIKSAEGALRHAERARFQEAGVARLNAAVLAKYN